MSYFIITVVLLHDIIYNSTHRRLVWVMPKTYTYTVASFFSIVGLVKWTQ